MGKHMVILFGILHSYTQTHICTDEQTANRYFNFFFASLRKTKKE